MFGTPQKRLQNEKLKSTPAKQGRKLTLAEKREIRKILESAGGDGKPHSAQDTLPFHQMYPDGLCKLSDTTWSRCIEFEDVNYQLAKSDDQTAIFEALCDMYNAHDASISMELSLVCRRVNKTDFRKRIEIAAQGDKFDGVRSLYTDMLRGQLEHGNNGSQAYAVSAQSQERDNPLRTAEMTMEDDYGMIDGVINNGRRGEEHGPERKLSIKERLADAKRECAEHKPPEKGRSGRDTPEHDSL